jgi:transcriptional regulator with XRE-family HTH domain
MDFARMACDSGRMAKTLNPLAVKIGAAIKAARLQQGLAGREVADHLKTTVGAVGNWERGANIPAAGNLFALAELLRIDPTALAKGQLVYLDPRSGVDPSIESDDFDPDAAVPIVGYVGAGDAAHYYAVSHGELERVPGPKDSTGKMAALDVRGDSLGPLFNHSIVYYDEAHTGVPQDHINRGLCVVGLSDDRILVKEIRNSRQPGRYDLISNNPNEPVIRAVEVLWSAKVTDVKLRS